MSNAERNTSIVDTLPQFLRLALANLGGGGAVLLHGLPHAFVQGAELLGRVHGLLDQATLTDLEISSKWANVTRKKKRKQGNHTVSNRYGPHEPGEANSDRVCRQKTDKPLRNSNQRLF